MPDPKCILLIGGARSGKSRYAQELAQTIGRAVLFVATAEAGDDEMKQRIEAHRRERPPAWRTLEAAHEVGRRITAEIGGAQLVLVDCITLLINNVFNRCPEDSPAAMIEQAGMAEIRRLIDCMAASSASFILVTNEVGMDIVPANELGRVYRDLLGRANQELARFADEVLFMVAGIPMRIKPPPGV